MTHSHDTATPALSVESEGHVPLTWFATMNEWFLSLPAERQAILRDDKWMLAEAAWAARPAAPAPNPSPAAKGGEAVVIPYDDFYAAYPFVPRSKMSPDCCLKTRLRSLLRAEDLAYADEAEALATPSPQPANAVRETRDHSTCTMGVGCETYGVCYADAAGKPDRCAALASDPAPAGEAVQPTLDNTEPHSLEFMKWLWRAYRQPADGNLDARMFTRWNMEVAYHAGKQAEAASHPAPEDTARLREDLERAKRQCEFYRNSLAHEIDNRDEALRERDDARKVLETARGNITHFEMEARRYADCYPAHSDGRNTFVIFADMIAARSASRQGGE